MLPGLLASVAAVGEGEAAAESSFSLTVLAAIPPELIILQAVQVVWGGTVQRKPTVLVAQVVPGGMGTC